MITTPTLDENYKKDKLDALNRVERLQNEKLSKIFDLTYEVNMLKEEGARIVRSIITPISHIDFRKLWYDYDSNNNCFSKECKEDKEILEFLEKFYFFSKENKKELLEIIAHGLDNSEYWFKYKIGETIFYICIPMFKETTSENYNRMFYKIIEETPGYLTTIFETRFIEELAKGVEDFLKGK